VHTVRSPRIFLGVVAMALVLAACGTTSSPSPSASAAASTAGGGSAAPSTGGGAKTIGVVSLAANNGGSARMIAAMKAVAAQNGWTVNVVDTAGDPTKVGPAIQSFVSAKVNGIAVDILDPSAIANDIAAAKQAGIPVISLNSDDYNPDVASQIVANPFDVGMQEATYIADRLGRKGNVAMLAFSAATNIRLRQEVLENALKAYPGIHIVEKHELDVAKALDDAQATVQSWLTKYPSGQLNAIWAAWDEPALGAAAAADAQSPNDLFVTGTDYSPAVGAKMKAGSVLQADWFVDYATIGSTAMSLFNDAFSGKALPPHVYVALQLVTPSNLPSGDFPSSSSTYSLYTGK
jgi:ribose transport system substrate-binding protein